MYNLKHWGYEIVRVYNLTNPTKFDNTNFIDKLKWVIVKQPKYSGRVWKKDQPDLGVWSENDEYFTFYKGRGKMNKGDRMVTFYQKEKVDVKNWIKGMEDEVDEPLY